MNQALAPFIGRLVVVQACAMILAAPLTRAQVAPAASPTAATLAKYDTNKNGRLDADETAAMEADQKKITPVQTTVAADDKDTVQLSPFEVSADTKGYYASSTLSGTRFNSKIEDMGASISVVTKEQMSDFAMLDINDVFLYTASTEGTGTYTDFTVDRNGSYTDNVEINPQGANRVRGIAAANVTVGNFETQGRNPVDPLAIDGIEISRGPNANISGLGSPAGTVNQVAASANTSRNRSQVQLRVDSFEGYRTSLDLNRVLVKDKLALRLSGSFQHDGYQLKPSGTNSVRLNGMLKFQPFKKTTVSGSYSYYRMNGNRPNAAPPRDQLSYWIASGKPTWDPTTQLVHRNGATLGPFPTAAGLPDYFANSLTGNVATRNMVFIDQRGLSYWSTTSATAGGTPIGTAQGDRYIGSQGAAGVALGHITAQPLFSTTPTINDKSIYDWESINLSAPNRYIDRTLTTNVIVDQVFLNTQRQSLVAQASFFREDSQRYARNLVGVLNQNASSGQLMVDVNEKLIDGTTNPYFLRPFIGTDAPTTTSQPSKWDTYRAQLAYKLDLTHEQGALGWLGLHQFTAYDEYKYRIQRQYRYREGIADTHAWNPANIRNSYLRFYVGDNVGTNVDYAPSSFAYGKYDFVWGDNTTKVFNHEPTLFLLLPGTDNAGGGSNSKTILKTTGAVLQSHFWKDRIVTTFGLRNDKIGVKFGATNNAAAPLISADLLTYNNDNFVHWAPADWRTNQGKTKTSGIVLHPFRDADFLTRMNSQGGGGHFLANMLGGFSLSYNQSDSFTPQTPAQDLFLKPLPNASGIGKDYGFTFNVFDGRFVIRVNHYINKSINNRNGDANTLAQRVLRTDLNATFPFPLRRNARVWVGAINPTWTTDQIEAEVAKIMGIPLDLQAKLDAQSPPLAATNDVIASGNEIELNYNPTKFWTVAGSVTQQKSITTHVSSSVQEWIDLRMPTWLAVKDPTIPVALDPKQLWWNHNYGGDQTAAENFATFVQGPYAVIHAQEGKPKPSIREYSAKFSTNVRLAGITEHRILKNMSLGGAVRWEDKAAIGFYGKQKLPAVITELDPNNPVNDKAHFYVDLFATYRTKLWSDKIGASFQLNVRNIQENGRLQATAAFPDGTGSSFRIVDPRQFILSATFDL